MLKLFLFSLFIFSLFGYAQDDSYTLGKIVVVADPNFEEQYDSSNAQQFFSYNTQQLGQAAALIPGVTLTNVGARNEQMASVRGFDLRQIPVLIDGVPVYLPYDGYVDLGRFFTEEVSEIQVSKEYTSLLSGPNNLAGVINLVGIKPTRPLESQVQLGATLDSKGDYAGSKVYSRLMGKRKKYYYIASGSFHKIDHLRSGNEAKIPNTQAEDHKLNLKFAYTPNARDEYSLNYINQQGEKGVATYDGTVDSISKRYWKYPEWDKQSLYWISKTHISDSTYLKTRLFYDDLQNTLKSYDDDTYATQNNGYAFTSYYDDHAWGGNIEFGHHFQQLTLKSAFHFKNDYHKEHNKGDPIQKFSDDTYSLGVEGSYKTKNSSKIIAGISYSWRESKKAQDYDSVISDFDSNKNDALNAQINYIKRVNNKVKFHSSIAYRTRFPTMKDRYSYKLGKAEPNPGLKEENSLNLEVGWDVNLASTLLGLKVFYYDIHDTIQAVDIGSNKTQMQNTGKSYTDGVELSIKQDFSETIQLYGNYNYIHRKNRSNNTYYFINAPRHIAVLNCRFQLSDKLQLEPSLQYSSSRHSASDGIQKVKAHTLANFYARYQLSKNTTLNLEVANLLDYNYELSEGYDESGRTYTLTGKFSF